MTAQAESPPQKRMNVAKQKALNVQDARAAVKGASVRTEEFCCLEFQSVERALLGRVDGSKMRPLQPLDLGGDQCSGDHQLPHPGVGSQYLSRPFGGPEVADLTSRLRASDLRAAQRKAGSGRREFTGRMLIVMGRVIPHGELRLAFCRDHLNWRFPVCPVRRTDALLFLSLQYTFST